MVIAASKTLYWVLPAVWGVEERQTASVLPFPTIGEWQTSVGLPLLTIRDWQTDVGLPFLTIGEWQADVRPALLAAQDTRAVFLSNLYFVCGDARSGS